MDEQPYPLPRETRESAVLDGDGGASYGPFGFKIFDEEDVEVWRLDDGETVWALQAVTVTKTAALGFDTFSILFPAVVPATTSFIVAGRRLHERDLAVTRGGAISAQELEKELSKQGSVLQELRRDLGRTVRFPPGFDGAPFLPAMTAGKALIVNADEDGLVLGPDADEITAAQGYSSSANDSAVAAALRVTYSMEWAVKAEGSLISAEAGGDEATHYSSFHWAKKAQEWSSRAEDSPISTNGGGDGVDDYSALHWAAKARIYGAEWATKAEDSLISEEAGGDEATDYSAFHWAKKSEASAATAAAIVGFDGTASTVDVSPAVEGEADVQAVLAALSARQGSVLLDTFIEGGTAALIDLDITGWTDYGELQIYIWRCQGTVDSKRPWLIISSQTGGFENSAADYRYAGITYSDGASTTADFNSSTIDAVTNQYMLLDNPLGSGSDETGDFLIRIMDPFHDKKRRFSCEALIHDDGGAFKIERSGGTFQINNMTPITNVFIGMGASNIKMRGVVIGIPKAV